MSWRGLTAPCAQPTGRGPADLAEAEITFVDGVLTGTPPEREQLPATYLAPSPALV